MKPRMSRRDLIHTADIWNAVIDTISDYDYPTGNQIADDAYLAFQYYSELESGGHESLLTWFSEHVEEVGIINYIDELARVLETIGAHDYAVIEKTYGLVLWSKFKALENEQIEEAEFYAIVEKADSEYQQLDGVIQERMEAFFVDVHTELIDVTED
ncbi:DMP19 family protein [Planococcus sp. YIM B11945]|uniref:DMP19 family protein n=1 Tax=Planococcus sp. YIM B11945 TaxID=3435410 RepID=UPI003D7D863B